MSVDMLHYRCWQKERKEKTRCEDMMLLLPQLSEWKAWQKPADSCSPWWHDPIWSGVYCACCGERAGTAFQCMSHTLLWTEEEKPDFWAKKNKKQCMALLCTPSRGDVLSPVSSSASTRWETSNVADRWAVADLRLQPHLFPTYLADMIVHL